VQTGAIPGVAFSCLVFGHAANTGPKIWVLWLIRLVSGIAASDCAAEQQWDAACPVGRVEPFGVA
jgi:hypothetical protein